MRAILALPTIYELWQAPFVAQKLGPFVRRVDVATAGRVIDLGCGPGTNARLFSPEQYLGIDLSNSYVSRARERYPHRFEVWDITQPRIDVGLFDRALINSVFHHLSDDEIIKVLDSLRGFLRPGASVHIIDLVLPSRRSLAHLLAKWDRGMFPRPVDDWTSLLGSRLELDTCEIFDVGLAGIQIWELVYIEGRLRVDVAADSSPHSD